MSDSQEYERVFKMLQEAKQSCETAIISNTTNLESITTQLQTISDTQNTIGNFYVQIDTAMAGIVSNVTDSFSGYQRNFKKGNHSKEFMPSKESTVEECFEILKDKKKIVFLTGAGLSAASGIPGFNGVGAAEPFSKNGITYKNEEIMSVKLMENNPDLFWERNLAFVDSMKDKKHNISHVKIQELMNAIAPQLLIVTQNTDCLHTSAFNAFANDKAKKVKNSIYEIHGNKDYLRCNNSECSQYEIPFKMDHAITDYQLLVCVKCKKQARPIILYFDEGYTEKHNRTESLSKELDSMDVLVSIGTMLQTGFAASLVSNAVRNTIPVIEINLTPACEVGAFILTQKAEVVVPELCDLLVKYRTARDSEKNTKKTSSFSIKQQILQSVELKQRNSIGGSQVYDKMKRITSQPVMFQTQSTPINQGKPIQVTPTVFPIDLYFPSPVSKLALQKPKTATKKLVQSQSKTMI